MNGISWARWAPLPIVIGVGSVVIIQGGDDVKFSAANALTAATATLLIYGPVLAGISAGLGVSVIKGGSVLLVKTLPLKALVKWFGGQTGASVGVGLLGFGLLVVSSVGLAGAHGSWPAPQAGGPVLVGALFVVASCAAGWAIGLVAPTWFVPPIVAILGYFLPAFDIGGSRALVAFATSTQSNNALFAIRPVVLVIYFGLTVLAVIASFLTVIVGLSGGTPWQKIGLTAAGLALVGCTVALVSPGFGVIWQAASRSGWPCATVGQAGSRVCLPPEQRQGVDQLASVLAPLDERVLQIAPKPGGWLYEPRVGFANEGDEPAISSSLPIGPDQYSSEDEAEVLAGSLVWCPPELDLTEDQIDRIVQAWATVTLWLDPHAQGTYVSLTGRFPERTPTLDEARAALESAEAICQR